MAIKGKKIGRKVAWASRGYSRTGVIVAVVREGEEMPIRFSRMRSGGHRNVDDRLVHWLRDHESYIVEVEPCREVGGADDLLKAVHPLLLKLGGCSHDGARDLLIGKPSVSLVLRHPRFRCGFSCLDDKLLLQRRVVDPARHLMPVLLNGPIGVALRREVRVAGLSGLASEICAAKKNYEVSDERQARRRPCKKKTNDKQQRHNFFSLSEAGSIYEAQAVRRRDLNKK